MSSDESNSEKEVDASWAILHFDRVGMSSNRCTIWQCKYCQIQYRSGYSRLKSHISGLRVGAQKVQACASDNEEMKAARVKLLAEMQTESPTTGTGNEKKRKAERPISKFINALPGSNKSSSRSSVGTDSVAAAFVSMAPPKDSGLVNVLMIGTGEYTTGFVQGRASGSDKAAGVVALVMMDLRQRGKLGRLLLCGTDGRKFPQIRQHMRASIEEVYALDTHMETFPADDQVNREAYLLALEACSRGDVAIIFTPDDTHFRIATACIARGLHVLVTKPIVKTLAEHKALMQQAATHDVLLAIEVHKRWDPIYLDARDRIQALGDFSFITSYMSQPKTQLETFRAWAGRSSDISYYLNSHHIDYHEWCVGETSRPVRVFAAASTGVARALGIDAEDTITLTVQWENLSATGEPKGTTGTAVYTSSWIAPKSDVHSQQRFFYMGQSGEVTVDQAHRGYNLADDSAGYRSANPLFMKYIPTNGKFSGQQGYGYRSLEAFVDAAAMANAGLRHASEFDDMLATAASTLRTTAILEAGRRSLDRSSPVQILYKDPSQPTSPTSLQ